MIFICMKCGGEFEDKGWKGGCPFGCGGAMFFPKHQLGGHEGESLSEPEERKYHEDIIKAKGRKRSN